MKKLIYDSDLPDAFIENVGGNLFNLVDGNLTKSASSSSISKEMLDNCKPDKDHFLVHLIALGDYETYSGNRNADAFPKKACIEYHDTFVKNGSLYREHRHDSKDKSIGLVKASAYNEEMGRIELAVWGHKKKAAEEWDLAKSGKPLSFSMSCSIPFDTCSACGFEAKSDNNRCEHIKYARGQYIEPLKKYAYMMNHNPTFFDISRVAKPADRIAHHIFIDVNLQKAASASGLDVRSSDYVRVGGIYIPGEDNITGTSDPVRRTILRKLAALSSKVNDVINNNVTNNSNPEISIINNIVKHSRFVPSSISESDFEKLQELRPDTFFYELVKRGCVLPFAEFMSYCVSEPISKTVESGAYKYALVKELPVVFENMENEAPDGDLEDAFNVCSKGSAEYDSANTDEVQKIMDAAKEHFSVEPQQVRSKVVKNTLEKKSSFNNNSIDNVTEEEKQVARRFSRAYGYYKLAAVKELQRNPYIDKNMLDFLILC